ncbi:MAG: hypothetical protein CDV28_1409 [Candidatus Electronema aureum]|uniref:Uncharacterized protein n=1 Tax=Candidatus Electronema aureum TaxID=2005002 RepID=A0A521FZ92_9BACT|nr:MAG: hypothetical protein CDV28_1409 [Candidatus Electronema aureum]
MSNIEVIYRLHPCRALTVSPRTVMGVFRYWTKEAAPSRTMIFVATPVEHGTLMQTAKHECSGKGILNRA